MERSPEAIEWVLRVWRKRSGFWPSQSDLDALFNEYAKLQNDQEQANAMEENRRTREQLKSAGEPSGPEQFAGLMKKALERIKTIPSLEPNRRRTLQERLKTAEDAKKKIPA